MRQSDLLRAAIRVGVVLALWLRCSYCPAALVQTEFEQPPSMFAANTAEREYCGPMVLQFASGKLVIQNWGFESTTGGRTWTPNGGGLGGPSSIVHLSDGRWAAVDLRPSLLDVGFMPQIRFRPGETGAWSTPVDMASEEGVYTIQNDRLIQTSLGTLVVATARATGNIDTQSNSAGCFYSTDQGATWSMSQIWVTLSGGTVGMQEPAIAELGDGRLFMLARTGKGAHYTSYSSDGGATWTTPEATTLTAANSSIAMKAMPDGRLFAVYEHAAPLAPDSMFPRSPLVWAISSDDGMTWSDAHVIDATPGRAFDYPSINFVDAGVLVTYESSYADPSGNVPIPPDPKPIVGGAMSAIIAYPTPEPGTLLLLATGAIGWLAYACRKQK